MVTTMSKETYLCIKGEYSKKKTDFKREIVRTSRPDVSYLKTSKIHNFYLEIFITIKKTYILIPNCPKKWGEL